MSTRTHGSSTSSPASPRALTAASTNCSRGTGALFSAKSSLDPTTPRPSAYAYHERINAWPAFVALPLGVTEVARFVCTCSRLG